MFSIVLTRNCSAGNRHVHLLFWSVIDIDNFPFNDGFIVFPFNNRLELVRITLFRYYLVTVPTILTIWYALGI